MERGCISLMNVTPSPCSSLKPGTCKYSPYIYLLTFKRVIAGPPARAPLAADGSFARPDKVPR